MDTIIIFGASYLYLVILVLAGIVFLLVDTNTKWKLIELAVVVFPLCFIVARLSGAVIASPRPFVVDHVTPLIHAAADNGFPSDHTLLSMAAAAIVFAYQRKWGSLLLGLAVLVGVARVLAGAHHFMDVAGSAVIAVSITYLAYRFIVNKIPFDTLYRRLRAS